MQTHAASSQKSMKFLMMPTVCCRSRLGPDETLYCESVDEHTFLYTASAFYQTALTLAELEGRYGELGYLRVSKSAVINLHRIRSLKSRTGGRIEASLENGERLVVSRHYAPLLRERLGL